MVRAYWVQSTRWAQVEQALLVAMLQEIPEEFCDHLLFSVLKTIKYLQKHTDEIRVHQQFWSEVCTSSQLCNYCIYFLWGVQNANDFLHQWICKSLQHFSKLRSDNQFHGYFDTSNLRKWMLFIIFTEHKNKHTKRKIIVS